MRRAPGPHYQQGLPFDLAPPVATLAQVLAAAHAGSRDAALVVGAFYLSIDRRTDALRWLHVAADAGDPTAAEILAARLGDEP